MKKDAHKMFHRPMCVKPQVLEIIADDEGTLYYRCINTEGREALYMKDRYDFNFQPRHNLKRLPRMVKKGRPSLFDE